SSGMGSGRYSRTARIVRTASNTSIERSLVRKTQLEMRRRISVFARGLWSVIDARSVMELGGTAQARDPPDPASFSGSSKERRRHASGRYEHGFGPTRW